MAQSITLDSLSVRLSAMKFREQIGLGQRNCRLDFGGDPDLGFLLFHNYFFFIFNHGSARDRTLI